MRNYSVLCLFFLVFVASIIGCSKDDGKGDLNVTCQISKIFIDTTTVINLEYDGNNQVSKVEYANNKGKVYRYFDLSYNGSGDLVNFSNFDDNGRMEDGQRSFYNNGVLVKTEEVDAAGNFSGSFKKIEMNSKGLISVVTKYSVVNGDTSTDFQNRYNFDANGNPITDSFFVYDNGSEKFVIENTKTFIYDNNPNPLGFFSVFIAEPQRINNEILKKGFDSNGEMYFENSTTYTYNNNGYPKIKLFSTVQYSEKSTLEYSNCN